LAVGGVEEGERGVGGERGSRGNYMFFQGLGVSLDGGRSSMGRQGIVNQFFNIVYLTLSYLRYHNINPPLGHNDSIFYITKVG
jgi:hypothetical protein